MAKAFSVASWNVKHFGATSKKTKKPKKSVKPIVEYLANQKADVVAIYEVVGKNLFKDAIKAMPSHQFVITEGDQTQEILIGINKKHSFFFTQKDEFKSDKSSLRPGALLTLIVDGQQYPVLFLHLKSSSVPNGYGLRDDMFGRVLDLRKLLDAAHKSQGFAGRSNFIFLGDLNTMGMDISYSDSDISGGEEIEQLRKRLQSSSVEMNIASKTSDLTWWPGTSERYEPSNLDHVAYANHLDLKQLNGKDVAVRGWVDENTKAKKNAWAKKYSDHALLYFEVQKV